MIERTFLHAPGIGPRRELAIWRAGVADWRDFLARGRELLPPQCYRLARPTVERSLAWWETPGGLAPLAAQLKPAADQLPLAAEIAVGIGKCLEGLERADDAYLAYLRVIGLYPAEPFYSEALYRAGRLQAAAGRWARADQLLGELIEHGTAAEFAAKAVEERKAVKTALAAAGSAAGAAAP